MFYRNMKTNEIVLEEDAEDFVLDKLGITVSPKGINGEYTNEQIENIQETVEWFFSGNWIEEDEIEEDKEDYYAVLDDFKYEEYVNRKMEE